MPVFIIFTEIKLRPPEEGGTEKQKLKWGYPSRFTLKGMPDNTGICILQPVVNVAGERAERSHHPEKMLIFGSGGKGYPVGSSTAIKN